ncbi:MAG: PAC2 family protein [Bifidobacteriaceae bacterium]|jgi:hypothetical protein|nr:PAC2 family protein [Bifidobacteriaceae bacterium]
MPTAIAAFAGWNDAGSAATDAIEFLTDALDGDPAGSISGESYCDLQVNRPIIRTSDDGERELLWPDTDFYSATPEGGPELVLISGVEPSFHWRSYAKDFFTHLQRLNVTTLWLMGALLADVPHTRPFKVQATTSSSALGEAYGLEESTYEGPAGIVSVLAHEAWQNHGIASGSLWVPVPHYVAGTPSPKAELALITKASELLGLTGISTSDLADEARAWTEGVDSLAQSNAEIAGYVATLENASDTLDSPASSGEAIAKEFERYLRRYGS